MLSPAIINRRVRLTITRVMIVFMTFVFMAACAPQENSSTPPVPPSPPENKNPPKDGAEEPNKNPPVQPAPLDKEKESEKEKEPEKEPVTPSQPPVAEPAPEIPLPLPPLTVPDSPREGRQIPEAPSTPSPGTPSESSPGPSRVPKEAEVPPVPPSTPPSPEALPETKLSALFNSYLDLEVTSDRADALEQAAGQVVAEVYNEDDQIRPKIWEIQNLIRERADQKRYSEENSNRVRILEAGLASAARKRDYYGIGKDSAVILGSAIGLAVLRGYHVDQQIVPLAKSALGQVGEQASKVGDQVSRGARKAFRLRTYREAGQRIERWFADIFRRLEPREKLLRNLQVMGLDEGELQLIQKKLALQQTESELAHMKALRFYHRTSIRDIHVAAVKNLDWTTDRYGYLAFQVHGGVVHPGKISFFRTDSMNEAEIRRIIGKIYDGGDSSSLADLISKQGVEWSTRLRADRFKDATQKFRTSSMEFARRMHASFDVPRAAQTFLYGTGAAAAGYGLALKRDFDFSKVELNSLLEGSAAKDLP